MLNFETIDTLRNGAIRFMRDRPGITRKEITDKKLAKILCAFINSIGASEGCIFNLEESSLYQEAEVG